MEVICDSILFLFEYEENRRKRKKGFSARHSHNHLFSIHNWINLIIRTSVDVMRITFSD